MTLLDDLVIRVTSLEQRLDRLADTEIVPFDIGCRVYNSTNISIANNTNTILTFDTEVFDTDSMHSTTTNTGRITISTAGVYLAIGTVRFAAAAGGRRQVKIRKNNNTDLVRAEPDVVADGTAIPHMVVSVIDELAATDYLELIAFQNSGSAINVEKSQDSSPFFMAWRLA